MDIDFGKTIRDIRERKGLTQLQVAERLGMDRSNYYRLEKKGNKITGENIIKLTEALQIDLDEFVLQSMGKNSNEEQKNISADLKSLSILIDGIICTCILEEVDKLSSVSKYPFLDKEILDSEEEIKMVKNIYNALNLKRSEAISKFNDSLYKDETLMNNILKSFARKLEVYMISERSDHLRSKLPEYVYNFFNNGKKVRVSIVSEREVKWIVTIPISDEISAYCDYDPIHQISFVSANKFSYTIDMSGISSFL
ncbi:helix-turn-helix domain-containing protein [Flammeovirga aprica]|uniref:Helix-turn-helix transcriptional regulator n=1 Tax=Flammeovirga aprica JL-4 TaxID=694437 RepID=A0A7X9RS43_9BACT|nr:helix-turn-helix transcriptional regulator [Flammeovirga aprica]NME66586.1 helix-turn-helix transcriptional regulator [Flammeovirga aprica JL-4]